MYRKKHNKHFHIIAFLLIFCTLTQNISYAKAEEIPTITETTSPSLENTSFLQETPLPADGNGTEGDTPSSNTSALPDNNLPDDNTLVPDTTIEPDITPSVEETSAPESSVSPEPMITPEPTLTPLPADTITIIQDGTSADYSVTEVPVYYENIAYTSNITPLKMNDTWMIPVRGVFSEILNCYYEDSAENNCITIKSPGYDTTIQFTPDNKIAVVNETSIAMPMEMVYAVNKTTGEEDYLIPLAFALEHMGYSHVFQDTAPESEVTQNALFITSRYLFHTETDDITFDTEHYQNALLGISVKENATGIQNMILGTTINPIASEQVNISENIRNYSITLQFLKTYNPFGAFTQQIDNGIVEKIEVWEAEDYTSCITVYYDKRYVTSSQKLAYGGMITLSVGDFSLKILMPDNIDYSAITTTDQYWNKKFLIKIPGNHKSFFTDYAPFINSTDIKKIAIKETENGYTQITVTTKGLKGYKLSEGNGSFTVKVGEPKDIYENIVLLDAGHGGKDGGASRTGIVEKHLCLTILYKYAREHFESPDSNVKAYWTRHNDTFIDLYTRPTLSAKYQADLFVSLHMNSASVRSANGTEIYYSKKNNKKSFSGITSKKFAKLMQNTLVDSLNNKDRGVKQAAFIVAKNNTVPAILIELSFITGSSDSKKLKKTSYQKKAAKAIYEGIAKTFKKYPTKR